MRLISFQYTDGSIGSELFDEATGQVWDIFVETHKITDIPNYGQWCQFLTVMLKLRGIIKS